MNTWFLGKPQRLFEIIKTTIYQILILIIFNWNKVPHHMSRGVQKNNGYVRMVFHKIDYKWFLQFPWEKNNDSDCFSQQKQMRTNRKQTQ